jgi:hypothetical protein
MLNSSNTLISLRSNGLSEGANKITARNKGLMYILYHTPDYETAQPVKIHIASGQVNGYFDVAKHQASDFVKKLK